MRKAGFQPDSHLSVAPSLRLSPQPGGRLRATLDDRPITLPWRVLSIIAALDRPRNLRDLIDQLALKTTGAVDWIELTSLIRALVDQDVLIADGADSPTKSPPPRPQGREIEMHIELLDDQTRTRAYLEAIAVNVRPGDVVVDLGTGNAVLAMAAARAGASRVYAIEASRFAEISEQIILANGLQDRITVVRGWSTRIELPERADLLISEIIGNDPLDEGVMRFLPDAVCRFLKPGGRVLPERMQIELQLLAMPGAELARHRISDERLQRWQEAYGFDFAPFAGYAAATTLRSHHLATDLAIWKALSEPHPLLAVKFSDVLPAERTETLDIDGEPHPAAAIVVRTLVQMPGCERALLCGGHWRWPVRLLPETPGNGRWRVTAKWGALKSGLELECVARPAD